MVLLVAASVSTGVYATNVGNPGFYDNFTVTIGPGVSVAAYYQGQDGSVFNVPAQGPTCSGNQCKFTITDNNTWGSNGHVDYLVGDQTKQGPYCVISMADGALALQASMSASCANGAEPSQLMHNDHDYQFSITKAAGK